MRILFLADAVFQDLPGGSRVVARELAGGLVQRGHDVTFLVGRHGVAETADDETRDGVRVVRYPGTGMGAEFVRQGRAACQQLLKDSAFDVVHTHFAYAALGPLGCLPRTVPHVRSFYGPWDAEGWVEDTVHYHATRHPKSVVHKIGLHAKKQVRRLLRREVEAANLRRSRQVIVLSEHSRREVLAFGYPAEHIRVIHGGTDMQRFVPAAHKPVVRALLGLPAGAQILLTVRRLTQRMGLDNLLHAMPTVVKACPKVLLLIGGKGPEQGRLEALIHHLHLSENVRMLGFIPDAELANYYQAADLFVLPTMALEGFGLVTTEALACGIPVIGTPVGATPEILGQLDARLIAPDSTPQGLSAAILAYLNSAWRRELTPRRLRQFVQERYTWDRHVEAVERLYLQLAGQAALPPSPPILGESESILSAK